MDKGDFKQESVTLTNQYGESFPGIARVRVRSRRDAFWAGGKRSAKLIGIVAVGALPFAFLEPFLFMVWGSSLFLILIVIVGPFLHFKFANEMESVTWVRGECPYCHVKGELKPFLETEFKSQFKILCSACGQVPTVTRTGSGCSGPDGEKPRAAL